MENKWMGINTAPKDRRILIAHLKGFVEPASYFDGSWLDDEGCPLKKDGIIAWQELPVFEGLIAE